MKMEKETTIYDIAKQLNISPATVSRALNDHPAINIDTKKVIISKAKELGYRTNIFASNLRRKKTNTIGVIVPRLNSYFMSTVLAGMEKVANEASYNLIIAQSLESVKKEMANVKTMFNSHVDGLLVSLSYDTENLDHFEPLIKKGVPILFFDRVLTHKKCTSIVIDNLKAGYEATNHLIAQGCKHIMHITGNLQRNVYQDRLKGYRLALAESGLHYCEELVRTTDFSYQSVNEMVQYLTTLKPIPDAIFITNDFYASHCIVALKQAGFSIPEDIAIVGFNDDPIAMIVEPNLTTVRYHGQEMGEVAAKSLINHLNEQSSIKDTNAIILHSELVVRASSLKGKSI
ncbi:MAG: LacI family DNA-binding transcriptional regulator [Thermoflexibacter sp.]